MLEAMIWPLQFSLRPIDPVYSHLHTHSCFSFLEGLPKPAELVKAAVDQGMPALALTDHLGLSGAIDFYNACRETGIKPILGLEVDLLLPYHLSNAPAAIHTGSLVLLAEDQTGWANLCRLSSTLLSAEETDSQPSLSHEMLEQYASGLICLTGGCRGILQDLSSSSDDEHEAVELLDNLRSIFPNRLYIELHQQGKNSASAVILLANLAARLGLPLAAAHNIYYLQPGQSALQRTLSAIRCIQPLNRLPAEDAAPPEAWFLPPDEMTRRFSDFPQALAATEEITQRCSLSLALGQAHYPQVPLPNGVSASESLRQKAYNGARNLYKTITPQIAERLETEIKIISERGYEPIFLIAEEMVSFARRQGIPSASRGSASSSLVAHCVGITTPDPLALDLYFERFLNPARTTPPDIDTDFCSRRRDDVIEHLFDTYGRDQVSMVGTINTFRPRSALSEVAKAHGFKPAEIRTLVGGLARYFHPGMAAAQSAGGPFADLIAQYGDNPRYAPLFEQASALLGLPHHLSVHPGGVVIAPGPIVDYVPVARSGGKRVTITQFDLNGVEQVGLVKLDLLGIRGLTVLGDVARSIYSWQRMQFDSPLEVLESVPADDAAVADLVVSGRTIGCFQIESPGMRATLKDIHARTPDDIIAALALYRPGPLKGGLRDAFVRRHNHQEPVEHIHPALSGLLHETYGVILYQEQVLRIAHELAGLSLADADLLRRAMSHFDPGKEMQTLQEKFVHGAMTRSGMQPALAERVWEMMAAFAGYGFPKAHAASYAQVAWRSAWCKTHLPGVFMAAVLANWGGYYSQRVYLTEARRLGLKVHPPHVNHSEREFCLRFLDSQPALFMGLDQVRDLTGKTQGRILRFRPYQV
jgi:DNA polymerase III subunit alpha